MGHVMKQTTMTFRLDHELRDDFSEAAKQGDQPAASVLRSLMRQYVARSRGATRDDVPTALPEDERQRRADAVAFAGASVGLEGLALSPEVREHAQRFISGAIDLPAFVKGVGREQSQER